MHNYGGGSIKLSLKKGEREGSAYLTHKKKDDFFSPLSQEKRKSAARPFWELRGDCPGDQNRAFSSHWRKNNEKPRRRKDGIVYLSKGAKRKTNALSNCAKKKGKVKLFHLGDAFRDKIKRDNLRRLELFRPVRR